MGVPAGAVAVAGDQLVYTGRCIYRGLSIRETAGAAATVRVFDGVTAAGTLLGTHALAANASLDAWYGDGGIAATTGIHFEVVAGTVEGSVRVG